MLWYLGWISAAVFVLAIITLLFGGFAYEKSMSDIPAFVMLGSIIVGIIAIITGIVFLNNISRTKFEASEYNIAAMADTYDAKIIYTSNKEAPYLEKETRFNITRWYYYLPENDPYKEFRLTPSTTGEPPETVEETR